MANELRRLYDSMGGLVEDNPLASGATTLTSAGLAAMPAVGSTEHVPIIFDPDGLEGAPVIKYITAHTAGATTATITAAAQEGTTARAISRDIPWVGALTRLDLNQPGGSGLIGYTSYKTGVDTSYNVTPGATLVDIDATNLKVTFVAPPSGIVSVSLSGAIIGAASQNIFFGLRDSGGIIADSMMLVGYGNTVFSRPYYTGRFAGLVAGTSYTWRWAWASAGATQLLHGPTYGSCVMEVMAVNI